MSGGPDHRLERLTFFSDAVIAIAITLLIIEIHAPHLHPGQDGWAALAALGPSFFGFALSFAVIGRFWVGHHSALAAMNHYDPRLLLPNFGFLMLVAFMPFSTAFLSANLGDAVPAIFYNVTLTVLAIFSSRVVFLATAQTLAVEPDNKALLQLRARSLAVIVAALLSVGLAFIIPAISQLGLLTMLLWARLFSRQRKVAA
jgi:uncharacterized membrane protein